MKRPFDTVDYIERKTPRDPKENYRYGDMYSMKDHSIVKQAVRNALSEDEQGIIVYSFWNNYSVGKIARLMTLTEAEVRRLYSSALHKIREYCLNEGIFGPRAGVTRALAA